MSDSGKPLLVVLLGAPGSGKGTQASSIVKKFGVTHISTGDMFRYHIKNKTPIGVKAKSYIDIGHLAPDEIVIDMLQDRLLQPDCSKGALLDGFPRTLAQAEALKALIGERYRVVVISLEVSDQLVLSRLTGRRFCPNCNCIYHVTFSPPKQEGICDECHSEVATRDDDMEATIKERLVVFHNQIGPLKEWYADQELLVEINGEGKSQKTAQACIAAIEAAIRS